MNRSESIISLKDVSFSFLQSGFHMENLKIDIKKGEFIGLVGESGSGKSTIGRLLAAIYNRKDAGSLASLDGSLRYYTGSDKLQGDIFDYSYNQLRTFRSRVQYIFQNHRAAVHAEMTVKETMLEAISLKYPKFDSKEKMKTLCEILDKVGLLENTDKISFEKGILSNKSRNLSGGQIKRLALARTLVIEPDVLIADEPLTGLDASRKGRVLEYITNVWQERKQTDNPLTVILISHDMGMIVRLCNRVIVLYGDLISKSACIVEDLGQTAYLDNRSILHPYTRQLMSAMDYFKYGQESVEHQHELNQNFVPGLGCIYGPMCPDYQDQCLTDEPLLKSLGDKKDHFNACFVVNP